MSSIRMVDAQYGSDLYWGDAMYPPTRVLFERVRVPGHTSPGRCMASTGIDPTFISRSLRASGAIPERTRIPRNCRFLGETLNFDQYVFARRNLPFSLG